MTADTTWGNGLWGLLAYLLGCGIVLGAGYARLAWVLLRDRKEREG
jgi:short subunit fatty acids transporter